VTKNASNRASAFVIQSKVIAFFHHRKNELKVC